jgi:sugar/nucleoside kinase (ribokinase family)
VPGQINPSKPTAVAAHGPRAGVEMLSFGSVFLEIVFGECERLPLPGEEIYIDSFAFSCGGAINSAVAASRAGAVAGLATLLGDDLGSRLVEEHCAREGVDLSASEWVSGPIAGITVALNFDGDRAFISHMPPRPPGQEAEVKRWSDVLQRVRPAWCYLHAGPGIAELMAKAATVGTKVALDTNFGEIDAFAETVVECARLAELFLPTEEELLRLTGAPGLSAGIAIASAWCPRVVVKRGPAGAIAVEGGQATEVTEGLQDVEVMDRTGAGDAFAGAVIAKLVRGAGFLEAVAAGNTAGSEAVARLGSAGEMREPGKEHRL